MKKIILFLLINALLFPLCTTVQGKKKKVRKEEKTVVLQLTEEQQRKYDYFFLEAIRMKEKKEYATALVCYNIAWNQPERFVRLH